MASTWRVWLYSKSTSVAAGQCNSHGCEVCALQKSLERIPFLILSFSSSLHYLLSSLVHIMLRCCISAHWVGGQGTLNFCSLHSCSCSFHAPRLVILVAFFQDTSPKLSFLLYVLTISLSFLYSLNQTCSFLAFAKYHFCMLSFPPSLVTADFSGAPLYKLIENRKSHSLLSC